MVERNTQRERFIEATIERIFTNGSGDVAARLVMTSGNGYDLGGWCPDAIRRQLREAWEGAHGD